MSRANPRLQGILEPDYQSWRHHPVTRLLLQYFADQRAMLIKEAVGRWETGALTLIDEHELRARSLVLKELDDLPFAAIVDFYGEAGDEDGG